MREFCERANSDDMPTPDRVNDRTAETACAVAEAAIDELESDSGGRAAYELPQTAPPTVSPIIFLFKPGHLGTNVQNMPQRSPPTVLSKFPRS